MVCVQCGQKTQVINSRPQVRNNQVWRRRQCLTCKTVFSTIEAADYAAVWAVKSPSKPLQPFSRDKLYLSLHRSCQHRDTAISDAAALAETVIKKLAGEVRDGTLSSKTIVRTAVVALNRFDTAASVHYQAFHRS